MFDLPNFIKDTIKSQGVTQKVFARKIGANPKQVSFWITGEEIPKDEYLFSMERIRGLPPQSIVIQKYLNKLEAQGIDLHLLTDPVTLAANGILESAPDKNALTQDQQTAARLAGSQQWQELISWAASRLAQAVQTPNAPAPPSPSRSQKKGPASPPKSKPGRESGR